MTKETGHRRQGRQSRTEMTVRIGGRVKLMTDSESGIFLCRQWGGPFHEPGMAPVGVRFAVRAVWPDENADERS